MTSVSPMSDICAFSYSLFALRDSLLGMQYNERNPIQQCTKMRSGEPPPRSGPDLETKFSMRALFLRKGNSTASEVGQWLIH